MRSAHPIHGLLCAAQDCMLERAQIVLTPGSAANPGLRGDVLAGAALQLLPHVLHTRVGTLQPANRMRYLAEQLVRLTCQGRCSTQQHAHRIGCG